MSAHRLRRRWVRRILLPIIGGFAAILAMAGTAFAYWATNGSGTGSATTGTLSVSVTSATLGPLYPGGSADVTITVNNPNPTSVQIASITAGTATGCSTPAITFSASGYPAMLNKGNSTFTLAGAATMGSDASEDCQGAAISLPITVTVKS